jgi:hypothetical protein
MLLLRGFPDTPTLDEAAAGLAPFVIGYRNGTGRGAGKNAEVGAVVSMNRLSFSRD